MEMVLRQMAQAPDHLSGKVKLRTQGWSQCGCSGPLTCIFTQPWKPQTWNKGIPASTSMPGGISSSRGPDPAHHYKVASVVTEPRAPLGGKQSTLAQLLEWKGPLDSHPPGQLTHAKSCVASCRQCSSYLLVLVSLLKQGQKQITIREIFNCTGWHDHKPYID